MRRLKQVLIIALAASPLDAETASRISAGVELDKLARVEAREAYCVACALWHCLRGDYMKSGLYCANAHDAQETRAEIMGMDVGEMN